jgi:hypothetical protein
LLFSRELLAEARLLAFLRCSCSALEGFGPAGAGSARPSSAYPSSAYPSSVCSHASSAAEYCACACGWGIFSVTISGFLFIRLFGAFFCVLNERPVRSGAF